MKLNQDKPCFLFSGHIYETLFANVGEANVWENKHQKLLDAPIDMI